MSFSFHFYYWHSITAVLCVICPNGAEAVAVCMHNVKHFTVYFITVKYIQSRTLELQVLLKIHT